MARRTRRADATAEAALMILVLFLVAVGGVVGWIVGHNSASSSATTVTVVQGGATTPAAPTTTAAAAPAPTTTAAATTTGSTAAAAAEKTLFAQSCGSCHTLAAAGTTGTVGPNLDQLKPSFAIVHHQVVNGGAVMPAFGKILTAAQINAVATYVSSVAGKS